MENSAPSKACSSLAVSHSVEAQWPGRGRAAQPHGERAAAGPSPWGWRGASAGRGPVSPSPRPRRHGAGAGCFAKSLAPGFSVLLAAGTGQSRQSCAEHKDTPKASTRGETLRGQREAAFQTWAASVSLTQCQTRPAGSSTLLPGTSLRPGPCRQLLSPPQLKKKGTPTLTLLSPPTQLGGKLLCSSWCHFIYILTI